MSPRGEVLAARRVNSGDLGISIALILAAWTLFICTPQARCFGDGAWMLDLVRHEGPLLSPHPLYAVIIRSLGALFPDAPPATIGGALSATCAALACGGVYLLCRSAGCAKLPSAAAVAMLAGTPAVWFFATTVEMHALSFLAVTWTGCAIVFLPWRRFSLALAAAALAVATTYLAHPTAALIGLGWVCLIRARRECDTGERLSWKRSWFVVAPVLCVTAHLLLEGLRWLSAREIARISGGYEWHILRTYSDISRAPHMFWYGIAGPLALLFPIAILGIGPAPRQVRAICLAALAPPLVIFGLVFTVPEWGGYWLGSVPFMAVLVAHFFQRFSARAWLLGLIGALIATQFGLSYVQIANYNSVLRVQDRIVQVRAALGESGLLVSDGRLAPDITFDLPDVSETSLQRAINGAILSGIPPAEFAASWERFLRQNLAGGPVAIDRSYALDVDQRGLPFDDFARERVPYFEALERMIEASYAVERFDDDSWPLLVIRQRN